MFSISSADIVSCVTALQFGSSIDVQDDELSSALVVAAAGLGLRHIVCSAMQDGCRDTRSMQYTTPWRLCFACNPPRELDSCKEHEFWLGFCSGSDRIFQPHIMAACLSGNLETLIMLVDKCGLPARLFITAYDSKVR